MMSETDVATWPTVADVAKQMRLSQPRILQLMHSGKLRPVQTRLGWLIDPQSVAALQAERAAHPQRKGRGALREQV